MVIKDTALCGLGQTSPNPVLSTMDNFYDEYLAHVDEQRCLFTVNYLMYVNSVELTFLYT